MVVLFDKKIIKINFAECRASMYDIDLDNENKFAGAVLAPDDNCYSINDRGHILRINLKNINDWAIIGSEMYDGYAGHGWGDPVLGADNCIYFPPLCHDRVLRFNFKTQSISLVGEMLGDKVYKWVGAVLASDRFIYCVPYDANYILQIDSRLIDEQVIEMAAHFSETHNNIKDENKCATKRRKIEL